MSTWSEELDEDFDFDDLLDYWLEDLTCARCGCTYLSDESWCPLCGHDKVMETNDE